MNRREALQVLAAGAAASLAPHELFALREARRLAEAGGKGRTLDAHQFATIKQIAEMIIPKTDTPGASDVGATEFIDLILTEWYGEEERSNFLRGLTDVDKRANTLFGKDFVDCPGPQQGDILVALGEQMLSETNVSRETARSLRASRSEPRRNFYAMLRNLTLTAYYTSEAGATSELHYEIVPGSFDGCVPAKESAHANKEASSQQ